MGPCDAAPYFLASLRTGSLAAQGWQPAGPGRPLLDPHSSRKVSIRTIDRYIGKFPLDAQVSGTIKDLRERRIYIRDPEIARVFFKPPF
jgi:hypothetical protein